MKIQSLNDYMTQAWCKLAAFSRDEKGASGIEYVLVAAIAVVAIAIFVSNSGVGARLTGILDNIKDNIGSQLTFMPIIFTSLLIIASLFDLKNQRVPNLLSVGFIIAALLWLVFKPGSITFLSVIYSVGMTLLLTLPGYCKGVFGAADIKILFAVALVTPIESMIIILLASFIIFNLYWVVCYRPIKQAPFIPAVLGAFILSMWIR